MTTNQEKFKNILRQIGSGTKTSHGMTREESANALELILRKQVTPAQIGAFMIAHRIRRPEPQELAGMLDVYHKLGPRLNSQENQDEPICFGMPFDGRNRTCPIYPLTSLILLTDGQPLVLQGGRKMPIKYGVTTEELFHSLGLKLSGINMKQVQEGFAENNFALIHQPDHFPLAENLIDYRDEIGKRPPIASMELVWTAHQGKHLLISGFVHPPTEERAKETIRLLGEDSFISIKGLEGSIDLPTSRPCITGQLQNNEFIRKIIHARNYNCHNQEIKWKNINEWKALSLAALNNEGPLTNALHWNAGVYLWFAGRVNNIEEGIEKSKLHITSGSVKDTLDKLILWRNKINLFR